VPTATSSTSPAARPHAHGRLSPNRCRSQKFIVAVIPAGLLVPVRGAAPVRSWLTSTPWHSAGRSRPQRRDRPAVWSAVHVRQRARGVRNSAVLSTWIPAFCSPLNGVTIGLSPGLLGSQPRLNGTLGVVEPQAQVVMMGRPERGGPTRRHGERLDVEDAAHGGVALSSQMNLVDPAEHLVQHADVLAVHVSGSQTP